MRSIADGQYITVSLGNRLQIYTFGGSKSRIAKQTRGLTPAALFLAA
jgi:hypothetical protein